MEDDGKYVVITSKTADEWRDQANSAISLMHVRGYKTFREFANRDKVNASLLVQALDALGAYCSEEMHELSGVKRTLTDEDFEVDK
jgi:cytosine/adenosine deaminase-related metal-dependent hydrolase